MTKLLKIDDITRFKENKNLFLYIANKVSHLVYFGGKIINFKEEFDVEITTKRWETSGARLFDKEELYSSVSDFEYLIIDLEGVHDLPESVYTLSELIEDIIKKINEKYE